MTSKLKKAIGAVKDQTSISLAKVTGNNSSTNLEVAVLKATTHDDFPVDERYISEVLRLVSSNKIHAAACARAIGKRIGRTRNWIVALKSLMLVLRIFQDGDPYFPREVLHAMKRGAKILNLSGFRDDSNSSPWDFTSFVRTFALYLDERLDCFLTGKLQRRYTYLERANSANRNKKPSNFPIRDLKPAMLLDRISYWLRLLERAIATRPTGAARANPLVLKALYGVVQESFDLYKDVSDGLSLLLDSFFHLQYQSCVVAFQMCVRAVKQFDELAAFYALCKNIGVGRISEYPSVQSISPELIESLQEFLRDQSSFPSPMDPEPPSPGSARSVRHGGFAAAEEESNGKCTSLEDLLSATETASANTAPAISIDLETYSDQFEKQSQRDDDTFRLSESGSTRSLPVSNSMADLLSLDDWTNDVGQSRKNSNNNEESDSAKGWELVLVEAMTTNEEHQQASENKGESSTAWELVLAEAMTTNEVDHQQASENKRESSTGWELVLFEAPAQKPAETLLEQNPLDLLSLDVLYNQNPHHYNPFLEDELPVMTMISNPPTFHATPTFSAKNLTETQYEDDPFSSSSNMTQQNYLHEQQLWLQHQNKIIAKHMA